MLSGYEWIWKLQFPTLKKDAYSLPCPLPQWPSSPEAAAGQTGGFATGIINIGELEIAMVKKFEHISSYLQPSISTNGGMSFFKPVSIPDGFHIFGHFSQSTDRKQLTTGYLLVAREASQNNTTSPRPLMFPLRYSLCWFDPGVSYMWKPHPPHGYQAMGFIVTTSRVEPPLNEIVCVRDDLVLPLEIVDPFQFATRGNKSVLTSVKGANIGHIFANDKVLTVRCLRNLNPNLEAMPNLEQVEALIHHYGPTVYFHPDEVYLPSSVPWFFNSLDSQKDNEFWRGNLEGAELYAYVKPALGGIFTDIDMWIFFPSQGPETFTALKLFNVDIYKAADQHVGDWEHFTLRINNFDGQLWKVYFSGHDGSGEWVTVGNLEFTQGTNKPIVYSSKSGHKTFPNAGTYIQGYTKLGIGMVKDVKKSDRFIDSSKKYQIIAAGYLGGVVAEPYWLKNMQEWRRPERVFYDGRSKVEKVVNHMPFFIQPMIHRLAPELYDEVRHPRPTEPTRSGLGMKDGNFYICIDGSVDG